MGNRQSKEAHQDDGICDSILETKKLNVTDKFIKEYFMSQKCFYVERIDYLLKKYDKCILKNETNHNVHFILNNSYGCEYPEQYFQTDCNLYMQNIDENKLYLKYKCTYNNCDHIREFANTNNMNIVYDNNKEFVLHQQFHKLHIFKYHLADIGAKYN
eukprot:40074_1